MEPAGLQPFNKQSLRAFHADGQAGPQLGECGVELVKARDVVAQADWPLPRSPARWSRIATRARLASAALDGHC